MSNFDPDRRFMRKVPKMIQKKHVVTIAFRFLLWIKILQSLIESNFSV